jgi:hypothetical protein
MSDRTLPEAFFVVVEAAGTVLAVLAVTCVCVNGISDGVVGLALELVVGIINWLGLASWLLPLPLLPLLLLTRIDEELWIEFINDELRIKFIDDELLDAAPV